MKLIITLLLLTITAVFGTDLPDQATKPLEETILMMGGKIFGITVTLALTFCGYLYLTGKNEKAKDWAVNIIIGSIFVLVAGTIGAMFG